MTKTLFVTLDQIEDQRERGWPDMHPEDYCHRCGGRNISWSIDVDVWDAIMRPSGHDTSDWMWNEIICPQCFTELFEAKHPLAGWKMSLDPATIGARAFEASGGI